MAKPGMDPDRYQMKDLKRRVASLERADARGYIRYQRLAQQLLRALGDIEHLELDLANKIDRSSIVFTPEQSEGSTAPGTPQD